MAGNKVFHLPFSGFTPFCLPATRVLSRSRPQKLWHPMVVLSYMLKTPEFTIFSQHGHHQNSKSIIMIGDTLICVRLSFFCSLAQLRLGRLWSLFEEEEECSFLLVIIPTSSHLKLWEIFNVGNSTTHCSWQDGWIDLLSGTGWLKILIYTIACIYMAVKVRGYYWNICIYLFH